MLTAFGQFARTRLGRAVLVVTAGLMVLALWLVWPFISSVGDIRSGLEHQPSRLWGASEVVTLGETIGPRELAQRLEGLGFSPHQGDGANTVPVKTYEQAEHSILVRLPERLTPEGRLDRQTVEIFFAGERVSALRDTEGETVDGPIFLGAPLLASYYGEGVREIHPVEIDELPEHVVDAVLAAEDGNFYHHFGLSPSGIARAAIVNAKEGEIRQGGSTITQQLIKNIYLSHDRSLLRKMREAVLAVLVEYGHTKKAILQAYLNQIYLGTGHGLNLYGFGTAARHYFGVEARDLTVGQAATLAGMIRSPGNYTPLRHLEAAHERRDQVLEAMAENGDLDSAELAAAKAEPITAVGLDLGARRAPYFADAMAEEARRRFGLSALGDRGYQIFTTLRPSDQAAAEDALEKTLKALPARTRLEGALVTVDPRSGRILTWVGGRDYGQSEFDRVRQARRQAGSAFKPVVLAAALESELFTPASRLEDQPLILQAGGREWRPANADGRFRGPVTVRRTIEESLNVPSIQLAQEVGLDAVAAMARRLGIEGRLDAVPSLALGAFEVSPLELATVYATFAAGGRQPALHGIAALTDARGAALAEAAPAAAEQVLDPRIAYQVTSILRGAVESGTASSARRFDVAGPLAGKTGTSNEARDSWFAAYRPDRVTVVWVGHDEPQPTPLSGARAALPLWGRYAERTYPTAVDDPPPPAGVKTVEVCRDSGLVPWPVCPKYDEVFLGGQNPAGLCDLHDPSRRKAEPEKREAEKPLSWLKRKLKKIF